MDKDFLGEPLTAIEGLDEIDTYWQHVGLHLTLKNPDKFAADIQ